VRKTDPRLQPVAVRSPIEHPVVIRTEPFFDELLIDGQLVAKRDKANQYGQVYLGRLPVGSHRVVLRNQACLEEENRLVIPAEPKSPADLDFGFRLKFKPALLVVDSPYGDSAVFVDSEFKGTAGASHDTPILIPIEGRTGQVRVQVRLTHPQAGRAQSEVTIRAGQRTTHKVSESAFAKQGPQPKGGDTR
jgi:hypothetical protein